MAPASGSLIAVSDVHVTHADNRDHVDALVPGSDQDWLILAGDIGDRSSDLEWVLTRLRNRFAEIVWAPGNHDLWTVKSDPLRGQARYEHLVELCRSLGVHTPEDPYPIWHAPDGEPIAVAPLFLLYDYSFRPAGTRTKEEGLARAYESGIVCSDEFLLHPDPYPSRDAWCHARVAETGRRLAAAAAETRTVLVNHFPLLRAPTDVLHYPEFALWCGTDLTADWHVRYRAAAVVYGHLHIPRTTWHDGVRFEEVSLGYPREWRRVGGPRKWPRVVLDGASVEQAVVAQGPSAH